eukprot:TRINITY_DN111331_c0_g1_i1.p1 TRINITY_DN111331_c0_g1~~TRINITY_DN111331_c0_g1_i1.p1  ORF type:complete len:434 (+),score=48.58 TRINITY_DN111331_c0_g1_i1:217-1518(+)
MASPSAPEAASPSGGKKTVQVAVGTHAFDNSDAMRAAGRNVEHKEPSRLICLYCLDEETGEFSLQERHDVGGDPGSLGLSPDGQLLFFNDETAVPAAVGAFRVVRASDSVGTKSLQLLSGRATCGQHGEGSCYVEVDDVADENIELLVSCYGSGDVLSIKLKRDALLSSGDLARAAELVGDRGDPAANCWNQKGLFDVDPELADRQDATHAHQIVVDPWSPEIRGEDPFAFVCDLGLDAIFVYRHRGRSSPKSLELIPEATFRGKRGCGPRHLSFHPSKAWVYVVNELDGTLSALEFKCSTGADGKPGFVPLCEPVAMLPPSETASRGHHSGGSDVHVSSDGRFVYAVSRNAFKNALIGIYAIDQVTGVPENRGFEHTRGMTPRNFLLLDDWLVVGNQDSNNLVVFRRCRQSGALTFASSCDMEGPPCCLRAL